MFIVLVLGFLIIILAAVLQAYCEFGRQARPDVKPKIFEDTFQTSVGRSVDTPDVDWSRLAVAFKPL